MTTQWEHSRAVGSSNFGSDKTDIEFVIGMRARGVTLITNHDMLLSQRWQSVDCECIVVMACRLHSDRGCMETNTYQYRRFNERHFDTEPNERDEAKLTAFFESESEMINNQRTPGSIESSESGKRSAQWRKIKTFFGSGKNHDVVILVPGATPAKWDYSLWLGTRAWEATNDP